jgi:hypothetical protein
MIDMSAPPAGKRQFALIYMIAFGYGIHEAGGSL